jgi:hypothetical protein
MGLLMELLMDVLSDGDAHVIARGGWMFELFFEGFLRPFDSSPSSDQSSSDRCMDECERHQK